MNPPNRHRFTWPLGGLGWSCNQYPRSVPVYRPQILPPNEETTTEWSMWGTFAPRPFFGGWDALGGRLMGVPQADTYDSSQNPPRAHGLADTPNEAMASTTLMRLPPHTSAHMGNQIPTGPSPAHYFLTPPLWGAQTQPVMAVGV